ncbi:MAG TPA: lasso peptide biosynthesis B2 protein [Sphingomicrobium sp.]|nr:lasso peptide biosynthesis B2 protein [Sphingomicrobium sp.]
MFAKAAKLGIGEWRDVGRAVIELAIARAWMAFADPEKLLATAAPSGGAADDCASDHDVALVRRVSVAIGRAGARVPWRSDCLVQALAAQRWLRLGGVQSDLFIGVRPANGEGVDAHAWLVSSGSVVTGGDVSGFTPLVTPDVLAALASR